MGGEGRRSSSNTFHVAHIGWMELPPAIKEDIG